MYRSILVSICLVAFSIGTRAGDFLASPNANPLLRGFYLPAPVTFRSWESQRWETTLSSNNIFSVQSNANESLFVDDESTRLQINKSGEFYARGKFYYRVGVPFLIDSGGRFDSTINRWHNWLGVSTDQRSQYSSNHLHLAYSGASGASIFQTESTSGVGDVSADLGWKVPVNYQLIDELSIWTSVKAPTGSKRDLRSNGAWDTAGWIHIVKRSSWPYRLSTRLSEISLAGEFGLTQSHGETIYGSAGGEIRNFARGAVSIRFGDFREISLQVDHSGRPLQGTQLGLLSASTFISLGGEYHRWSFGFNKSVGRQTVSDVGVFLRYRVYYYDE
jgi:hypothetical protein